jgi:3-phosphoshikimate 1-carboxyvinyltransferase
MASSLSESIRIEPVARPIDADVRVPGSKSITNRALLIAGLANGESRLAGMLFSDDTRYMAEGLAGLGLTVETDRATETAHVVGGDGSFPNDRAELYVGNSGTTMRFLTAALAVGRGEYRVDGNERMRARPIGPLLHALHELGSSAWSEENNDCPPVIVNANGLIGGACRVDGGLSSQYFSAVMMAAPHAINDVELEVIGDLVSKPYMEITAAVMRDFGVEAELDRAHWRRFQVAAGQRYQGRAYQIEPDASNASYFFAAAAVTGGRVRVPGLGSRSTQGDLNFVHVLERMGATVAMTGDATEVTGPAGGTLRGIEIDMNALSDTAQTLAAIAPFAEGPTTIRGIAHNRHKETDRIADLATELRRIGQEVVEFEDGLTITPRPVTPAQVATYDDHRMAMSFAVTGLRAAGIEILDPGCTAKTFPDYFDRLAAATRTAR